MEQLIPTPKDRFTVEEYLQLEDASQSRHEFRHGRIIDMAGGSLSHGMISANLLGETRNQLKGKLCFAVGSDVRVKIAGTPNYYYPDVMIFCNPPVFDPPDRQTTIVNPKIVIEVTSPTTATDDRSDKFYDYMRIESLAEYILVAQDRKRVDSFYRQSDGIWAIGPSWSEDHAKMALRSVEIEIPLSEIYAGVDLTLPG